MPYSVVQQLNMNLSGKYFFYSKITVDNSDCISINMQVSDGSWKIIDEQQAPELNKEYELMGKIDLSNGKTVMLQHLYGSQDMAINKSMYAENFIGVKISDEEFNNLSEDQLKMKYAKTSYFEGLQPTLSCMIQSVGKNLLDISKAVLNKQQSKIYNDGQTITLENTVQVSGQDYWVDIPISLEKGKDYYFQNNIHQMSGDLPWEVSLLKSVTPHVAYVRDEGHFVAQTDTAYLRIYQYRIGKATARPILVEGLEAPAEYLPYESSQLILNHPMAK